MMARLLPTMIAVVMMVIAVLPAAAEIRTTRSDSYTIHTDLPEDRLASLSQHLDETYAAYLRRFSSFPARREAKPDLYLFKGRQSYINFLKTKDIDAASSGGMFFVRNNESGLATWVEERPMHQTLQTLQHEGFHQFAYEHIGGELPLWVNEGLAVYFENARQVKGTMKTGLAPQYGVERLKVLVKKKDGLIDFEQLLKTDSDQWFANMRSPERGTLQYLQSWSIVYFLIHGNNGQYRKPFEAYLRNISRGSDHAKAFENAFGTDQYDTFAERWREFLRNELEPDPYSTALDRLEFLASGVLAIDQHGMRMPTTLNGLETTLKRVHFRLTVSSQGGTVEFKASDREMYRYRDQKNFKRGFEFTPKRGGGIDGLPLLSAPHLEFEPRIEWVKRGDEIGYDIVFE